MLESSRLAVVRTMRSTLGVEVCAELTQQPAPVVECRVRLYVRWSPDDGPDVDPTEFSRLAGVDVESYLPEVGNGLPDVLTVTVGSGMFYAVDLEAPDCWKDLAARSLDLGLVGEALLGEKFDEAELRTRFEIVHERAIIVANVEVLPQWQGGSYGLLATEVVLRELGRSADVAALYPMKPGLADLSERAAAAAGLAQYWGRIGFTDFNGIMARAL